jgi:hypothetical protein
VRHGAIAGERSHCAINRARFMGARAPGGAGTR